MVTKAVTVVLLETLVHQVQPLVVVAGAQQVVGLTVALVAQLSLVQLLQHTLTTAQFMDQ